MSSQAQTDDIFHLKKLIKIIMFTYQDNFPKSINLKLVNNLKLKLSKKMMRK